jgi:hypothetical protein
MPVNYHILIPITSSGRNKFAGNRKNAVIMLPFWSLVSYKKTELNMGKKFMSPIVENE